MIIKSLARTVSLRSTGICVAGLIVAATVIISPAGPALGASPRFKVIATVNVRVNPFGETLAPDGRTVWIANSGVSPETAAPLTGLGHTVTVLNERTFAIQSVINVGKFPEEITFSRGGRQAFVTNSTSGTVSVINTAKRSVRQTVRLSAIPMTFPYGIIAAPRNGKVFVTSVGGASAKTVAVLCDKNPAAVTICDTIKVPRFTGGTALTPDGKVLVITRGRGDNGPPEVTLINPATDRIIGDLSLRRGGAAQTVAITPNGKFAYSAIYGGPGGVWVINLASRKTVKVIPTPDKGMIGTAVSPNGRFVIATDFTLGEVSIISTATQAIVATVPVGKMPNGVVFSADGRRAFVANQGATTISVISFPAG